mmetsp:Transcript_28550/g.62305  ORF Transcript_28550/g.62305 Transcript_28550/m.62305 type:complete len:504 (+) Transcript_28550:54-1565(+)
MAKRFDGSGGMWSKGLETHMDQVNRNLASALQAMTTSAEGSELPLKEVIAHPTVNEALHAYGLRPTSFDYKEWQRHGVPSDLYEKLDSVFQRCIMPVSGGVGVEVDQHKLVVRWPSTTLGCERSISDRVALSDGGNSTSSSLTIRKCPPPSMAKPGSLDGLSSGSMGALMRQKGYQYRVVAWEVTVTAQDCAKHSVSVGHGQVLTLYGWDAQWKRRETRIAIVGEEPTLGWVSLDDWKATPTQPLLRPCEGLHSSLPVNALLTIISEDDIHSLQKYIREGHDLNQVDSLARSPLDTAGMMHRRTCCILLVKGGADPMRTTPLPELKPFIRRTNLLDMRKEEARLEEEQLMTCAVLKALGGRPDVNISQLHDALRQMEPSLLQDAIQVLRERATPAVAEKLCQTDVGGNAHVMGTWEQFSKEFGQEDEGREEKKARCHAGFEMRAPDSDPKVMVQTASTSTSLPSERGADALANALGLRSRKAKAAAKQTAFANAEAAAQGGGA